MLAAHSNNVRFANGDVDVVVGGRWQSRDSYQPKLIATSSAVRWDVGDCVYTAKGKFAKHATPLFGIVQTLLPEALASIDAIVTVKCGQLYASQVFIKGVPLSGSEAIHNTAAICALWLSAQNKIGVVYCSSDVANEIAQVEGKDVTVWDVLGEHLPVGLPRAIRSSYVTYTEVGMAIAALPLIVLSWPFVEMTVISYTAKTETEAAPTAYVVRDNTAFLEQCYKLVSQAGPRTYGFEVEERGCVENAALMFPVAKPSDMVAIQVSRPTGEVHAHLATQLSRQAFEDWVHLKIINEQQITSGVVFEGVYLPATGAIDTRSVAADVENALFAITKSVNGDLLTGRTFNLNTSLEDAVARLSEVEHIEISSIIEQQSDGKTPVVLVIIKTAMPIADVATVQQGDQSNG